MHLRDYLLLPRHFSVAEIRQRMNDLGAAIKDDAQIRQWAAEPRPGKPIRRPDAANAHYLELATDGRVSRQSMRPDDYKAIWPELPAPTKQRTTRHAVARAT